MSFFYEDEDFFEKPTKNVALEAVLDSLRKEIREDIIFEVEQLRKENAELREIKLNMEKLKHEHTMALIELQNERIDLQRSVRMSRVSELLKGAEPMLFKVHKKQIKQPKCDKCNSSRRIEYYSPQGNLCTERCNCDIYLLDYEIKTVILYEMRASITNKTLLYTVLPSGNNVDILTLIGERDDDDLIQNPLIVSKPEDITFKTNTYDSFFKTTELAELYIKTLKEATKKEVK